MDYKSSGVDTEKARKLITSFKTRVEKINKDIPTGKVVDSIGGFAGSFSPAKSFHGNDVVACTDGVGTKLKICRDYEYFEGCGQDLVAMCVNDLYCTGASPAFFLDYIACGRLNDSWYLPVLHSIGDACQKSSMALLGGESAEHPGIMQDDEFDLAGFCVGFVNPEKRLPKLDIITEKDVVYALPSSGLHSNGFSLIRKMMQENKISKSLQDNADWIKKNLLVPTRIYTELQNVYSSVKAICHLTGGGLYENAPRIIPSHLEIVLEDKSLSELEIFDILKESISERDLYATFNMGQGVLLVSDLEGAKQIEKILPDAVSVGYLRKRSASSCGVVISGIDT